MKILYLCNRKKCSAYQCNTSDCIHTANLKYAKNFTSVPTTDELTSNFMEDYPGIFVERSRQLMEE